MRLITIILLLVCLSTGLSLGGTSEIPINNNASTLKTLLDQYIESASLQFSIYSYKPSLEGLADTLQAFGVQNIPSEFMSTLSVVFNHSSELDSRLEIGYWQAQLDTPPTAASLKATLVPISYQLIYRPVLLYQYIPIYLGAGFGTMRANFQGDIVDLLAEGGITLTNDATTTVGYVILGYELLQWKSPQTNRYTLGKNASVNIELKHILKTIETTGNQPINIVLDGTAIGISISSKF